MKNFISFLSCSFLILNTLLLIPTGNIQAQNALGCGGLRYLDDVAADTTKKVVQFGSNINALNQTQNLFMDVVEPKNDAQATRPVIILAFGGGFVAGSRADMAFFAGTFAKKGYVVMSIDYRLWTSGGADSAKIVPIVVQATQDMKAAIRYVRKSAKADGNPFKVDTNNIIIGGVSAGAIAAMHAAHMDSLDNIPTFLRDVIKTQGGIEGFSGNPGYSSKVKGVINLSGGLYRAEWIDTKSPAFVSYHGTADNVVPYDIGLNVYNFTSQGSAACDRQAKKVGVPTSLYTVQGGGHAEIYGPAYLGDLIKFLGQGLSFNQKLICGTLTSSAKDIVEKSVKISPNPAHNDLNFDFSENTEGGYQLQVFDLIGRQVFNSGKQTATTFNLKKEQVGKGLFIAKIRFDENRSVVTRKIVFE